MTADDRRLFAALFSQHGGRVDADSLAIVIAHPDDESVGVGGHVRDLIGATMIMVTDGAPDWMIGARRAGFTNSSAYAEARRNEFLGAMALAGIPGRDIVLLGVKDQEVAFRMTWLTTSLADCLRMRRTRVVLTHAFEGGHPDHDATALAVHAACMLLRRRGLRPPRILDMPFYRSHGGRDHYQSFLSHPGSQQICVPLNYRRKAVKRRLLDIYITQRTPLDRFTVSEEKFRPAPQYDFRSPPGEGPTYYEKHQLGMTRDTWFEVASALAEDLSLELTPG